MAAWVLREIGRELRVARITSGMTQGQVAARLSTSITHISRVEHGLIKGLTMAQIYRHSAAVGLKPYVNLYPLIGRPLDQAQLTLIARFRERIGTAWQPRSKRRCRSPVTCVPPTRCSPSRDPDASSR